MVDGVHVDGPPKALCGIKPYKDQKCPSGYQAHHIVPDYALRFGTRGDGAKGLNRIPGMPSLDDGPAVCLSGGSKTPGTGHNLAHEATDPKVAALGNDLTKGGKGVAPIGDILTICKDEVSKLMPEGCADEVKKEVDKAFKGVNKDTFGRTTQQPPKAGTDAFSSLSRGDMFKDAMQAGNRR